MSRVPSDKLTAPAAGDKALVIVLSIGLVAYSSTVQLIPGFNLLYVPLGLVATTALAFVAKTSGLGLNDVGLERDTFRSGLRLGLFVAAVAATCLLVAVAVPPLHPLFEDARVADFGAGLVAYRALIRIPFGTALFEEFAFRGVLFGAWRRWSGTKAAAVGSSIVFGLWHIRPAIDLVNANDLASAASGQAGVVIASVATTAGAGIFFCILRVRSRSLVAPLVAHAAINAFALVAAAFVNANS